MNAQLARIRALVTAWFAKIDTLSLRERAILLVGLIAVIYFAWDLLLMQPLESRRQGVLSQIEVTNSELIAMGERLDRLDPARAAALTEQKREQLDALRVEIEELNSSVASTMKHLIRPADMTRLLQGVLRRSEGLELRKVNGLGATTVNLGTTGPSTPADDAGSRLYRHGLSVEFGGDFFDTLAYLRELEAMEWKFFWESVDFEVGQYPAAVTTIRVFTLSLDERWIGG